MTLHCWCCQEALTKHNIKEQNPSPEQPWRGWEHSLGLESITALMATFAPICSWEIGDLTEHIAQAADLQPRDVPGASETGQ